MLNLSKGEIYWVDLDPSQGSEMQKVRPCVIIKPLDYWKLAVIVPLSTTNFQTSAYTVVGIEARTGGLQYDSALCHHIRSISYTRIRSQIGTLPEIDFHKIVTALEDFIFDE